MAKLARRFGSAPYSFLPLPALPLPLPALPLPLPALPLPLPTTMELPLPALPALPLPLPALPLPLPALPALPEGSKKEQIQNVCELVEF